mgnify:CR=1 FL=1
MTEEPLPVHETVKVIAYTTIYKTTKWWCAVVLANMFGHDRIMIYQWRNKDGRWKRKQKFGINFTKDWNAIKAAIEEYIPRMSVVQ